MMMHSSMNTALLLSAAFTCGLGFGWGYFVALRRWVRRYGLPGGRVRGSVAALARLAAAAVFFTAAARWGALALLASFLGFLVARLLALRAVRAGP